MSVTPKIPLSQGNNHLYADMRYFLGVLGFVLSLGGGSFFQLERLGERFRSSCLFSLFVLAVLSTSYARTFNDLRLCITFQLIACIAVPIMTFFFPPKYTHSRYWL